MCRPMKTVMMSEMKLSIWKDFHYHVTMFCKQLVDINYHGDKIMLF